MYERLLSVVLVSLVAPAFAAEQPVPEDAFASCVAGLKTEALDAGISASVVDQVLDSVERVDRVIELDRQQPEFTQTFSDYYNRRVTPKRVEQGRQLLAEHRALLDGIRQQTGVPAHYLVAFWGLETNFGSYFGNIPVPASLTTLACDERRSTFFTAELINALRIIDAGDIEAANMVGSWAGAMGHVQFMPSVFLKYAVDADGDGRRDLWGSIEDALASAASFLRGIGWQPGLRWGREVLLPDDFDYGLAGRSHERPLSDWVGLGITDAYGRTLPALDVPASLLVPSGHGGPAFLVYDNFEVIMRWNRSEFYALSVGRLADEIAGAAPLQRPPPEDAVRFSRDEVRRLQSDLVALGYDIGEPDGIFGPATRTGLSRFQKKHDMVADGHLDGEAMEAVRKAVRAPE